MMCMFGVRERSLWCGGEQKSARAKESEEARRKREEQRLLREVALHTSTAAIELRLAALDKLMQEKQAELADVSAPLPPPPSAAAAADDAAQTVQLKKVRHEERGCVDCCCRYPSTAVAAAEHCKARQGQDIPDGGLGCGRAVRPAAACTPAVSSCRSGVSLWLDGVSSVRIRIRVLP